MRQGITTKYLGPTNSRGSRIKAIARKAMPSIDAREMALTLPYDYAGSTESRHTQAAQALATKLGWAGLWIGGGKPDEDGYQYVNAGVEAFRSVPHTESIFGEYGVDWFYVSEAVKTI